MAAAALEAGAAILRLQGEGLAVTRKADRSPVTAADRAAETIILRHLLQAFPDTAVVAEEEMAAGNAPRIGNRFFLVDPLDGTQEFIRASPDFTVNIALVDAGRAVLGVVYAPAHRWLFAGDVAAGTAWRATVSEDGGAGAWQAIRARQAPDSGFTVLASRSHRAPATDAWLKQFDADRGIERIVAVGSSLKFCLLAAGKADLYPRFGPTMEWDTAAGHAVLAAAGGRVTTPAGAPLLYSKPDFRNGPFIARGA